MDNNNISKEEKFHQSRIAFAVINGKLEFTIFDKRDHKQWLSDVFNITDDEFENIIRGYIKESGIYIYRSSKFCPVNMGELSTSVLKHIKMLCSVYVHTYDIPCYSGMKIGNAGEEWEPKMKLGKLDSIIKQRTNSFS